MPYGYIGYDNSPVTKNGVFSMTDVYELRIEDKWKTRELTVE